MMQYDTDMQSYKDADLFVLGESHCLFFNGTHERLNNANWPDLFAPVIRSYQIHLATAHNLIKENSSSHSREVAFAVLDSLIANGFDGWLMLAFGSIDISRHLAQHALYNGLNATVKTTVDRYVQFIDEVRARYPKVAIWGPVSSVPDSLIDTFEGHYGVVTIHGTEIDRNYSAVLFTRYLEQALAPRAIPFLTLLDVLLLPDGRSNPAFFFDGIHLHKRLMPYALDLVEKNLGVTLPKAQYHHSYKVTDIAIFSSEQLSELEADEWMSITLTNDLFIDTLRLEFERSDAFGAVYLSLERDPQSREPILLAANLEIEAGQGLDITLRRFARRISIKYSKRAAYPKSITVRSAVGYFADALACGLGTRDAMYAAAGLLTVQRPPAASGNTLPAISGDIRPLTSAL